MDEPSRDQVWKMFNRISSSYDRVNRILSMGLDISWRKTISKYFPKAPDTTLLDLATGTGDQLFSLIKKHPTITKAVGIDLAEQMLEIAEQKKSALSKSNVITFERQSMEDVQYPKESFDCATLSFGIRNATDVPKALREIHRVLKPSGKTLILEFSMPNNRAFRALYLFYLRRILPKVGGFFSKDPAAYRYLNQTIETFPSGKAFEKLLLQSGFSATRAIPLSFGIVTLYIADK